MRTASIALSIAGVTKRYARGVLANDAIDLELRRGDVFGLLGPNGAGKTTLVRQIIGLSKPTFGTISLDGHDVVVDPAMARRSCALLPQGALPIDPFRAREVVELVGRIRGADVETVRQRAAELFRRLEIEEWADTLGARLSGGVRRLVGFAMAAVWPPALVILDEPTNDVDPLRRRLLWKEIRRLGAGGATVLLVTHNVLEAEQSVHRLAIIDRGRIVAQGTPSSLKSRDHESMRLWIDYAPGAEPAAKLPSFVREHVQLGRRLHCLIEERHASAAIDWVRPLLERGAAEEYALGATTLEDTYIRLIGRADALELDGAVGRSA